MSEDAIAGLFTFLFFWLTIMFYIALYAFFGYVQYRVAKKAGLDTWWHWASFIPGFSVVVMIYMAFTVWPVEAAARRNYEQSHLPNPPVQQHGPIE